MRANNCYENSMVLGGNDLEPFPQDKPRCKLCGEDLDHNNTLDTICDECFNSPDNNFKL